MLLCSPLAFSERPQAVIRVSCRIVRKYSRRPRQFRRSASRACRIAGRMLSTIECDTAHNGTSPRQACPPQRCRSAVSSSCQMLSIAAKTTPTTTASIVVRPSSQGLLVLRRLPGILLYKWAMRSFHSLHVHSTFLACSLCEPADMTSFILYA